MGNHVAGRAMVRAVEAIMKVAPDTPPLAILDEACRGYEGCDAEFDDERCDDRPFGQVLGRAFNPEYDGAADPDDDVWFETVVIPFSERYGLT